MIDAVPVKCPYKCDFKPFNGLKDTSRDEKGNRCKIPEETPACPYLPYQPDDDIDKIQHTVTGEDHKGPITFK